MKQTRKYVGDQKRKDKCSTNNFLKFSTLRISSQIFEWLEVVSTKESSFVFVAKYFFFSAIPGH